ncbi:MAG: PBP1A family penicillin-binding protein [Pseudomonadota bacterium]
MLITTAFVAVYFYYAKELPDIKSAEDYQPPVLSQVKAGDGQVIGEFWTECRIFLQFEKIPPLLRQAFVAAEDQRFFEHRGVDIRSIVRAFKANLKAGEVTQGGSTITQQITRSILLSSERTIDRKIKEAILATRLERRLDKEQILTLYLNQIYLGNRAYGVGAAARNYFHKNVDELNLAEIALLAALPSAPNLFSPLNNPDKARERQSHVLNRMLTEKIITSAQMQQALEQKLNIYVAGIDKDFTVPEAAYFVEEVRRLVKENYGDKALYKGGLKIYTGLNLDMQKAAYQAVHQGLEKIAKRQGWTGPVDYVEPKDIEKKAAEIASQISKQQPGDYIVWPADISNQEITKLVLDETKPYQAIVVGFIGDDTQVLVGNVAGIIPKENLKWAREFSNKRANYDDASFISDPRRILRVGDIVWVKYIAGAEFALFQPPEVQAAIFAIDPYSGEVKAMIGGYDFKQSEFNRSIQSLRQPGSAFKPFVYAAALDKGYNYETQILDMPVEYILGNGQIWRPKNYGDYKGPTSFRNALVFSRNIPTVKIVADIGTDYLTAYARKLGLTSPLDKYLSMALGANGVSLSEMVPAYATFLNNGKYREPIYIRKIIDAKGQVLQAVKPSKYQELITPKAEAVKMSAAADNVKLNSKLFEQNKVWLEKDKLNLTENELKILYGDEIPEGHVITPQTAYLMVNLLKGVVEGGTGTRVRELKRPAAGKTGTTNDETDTWFIGFVPDLVAGVWVGFDEIKPIGRKETGGRTAAPIFVDFMQEAVQGFEAKNFERPAHFPGGDMATLIGGSAVFGPRDYFEDFSVEENADRAGVFFEEDLEEYSTDQPGNPLE